MSEEFRDIPIDEHVIGLARWAVDEYNKQQQTDLGFRGVWSAQVQTQVRIVPGNSYRIVLGAVIELAINKYEAQLFVPLAGDKVLGEFKPLLQAQA